ncbi:MAG: AroM family protein [Chloroflexi bacterium]|nr:AroM family protein [Chloroflexota bacterium]
MSRVIGTVTVGQAPRSDVVPEVLAILGSDVEVVECGALDKVGMDVVRAKGLDANGPVLVTRMRDGTEVRIREGFVVPRMQACLDWLQPQVDVILMLCTGSFPEIRSDRLAIYPEHVLYNVVRAVQIGGRLGVLCPAVEQEGFQYERWGKIVPDVVVASASPYTEAERLPAAAETLRRAGAGLIVMDCIGYTRAMGQVVRATAGIPTIVARSALAHVAATLLE